MTFDYWLFDTINGVAGRLPWLDVIGRWTAVYGLLAVFLLAAAIAWWPRLPAQLRSHYLLALLFALVACTALLVLEWVLAAHFHLNPRARPANARWVTLLVTERSLLSFPAWPVVFAFALAVPTTLLVRRPGGVMLGMGGLIAVSLIFVGVNFPFDVLTGIMLGSALGMTAGALAFVFFGRRRLLTALHLAVVWLAVLIWGGVMAVTIRPAHTAADRAAMPAAPSLRLSPPEMLTEQLALLTQPGTVTVQAATNGHLRVAVVRVTLPDAQLALSQVEQHARALANTVFSAWEELDLLTIEIAAEFPRDNRRQVGTLYTATIARAEWPSTGFTAGHPLPGKKFYHARFYAPAPHSP